MKTLLFAIILTLVAGLAFAADVPVAAPTVLDTISLYIVPVLGCALAISEGLALLPCLKSNGILDTIVKGLKLLLKKGE